MLKLQLLDPRFFEGAKIRNATVVAVILTTCVFGGCIVWTSKKKMWAEDMKAQAAAAATNQSSVDAKKAEIDGINAEVAPFDAQLAYIKSLRDYSDNWPQHLRMLSRYIYNRAEVLSVTLTPTDFNMQVRTKTTADVARLLMNLKRAYDAGLIQRDSLTISGLTGWPNPTSPRGWGRDTRRRIEVPFTTGDLQGVNSGSRATSTLTGLTGMGGGGGAAAGPGSSGGGPGGPGGPAGPPSAPGPPSGGPRNESAGSPGGSGGGPGAPGGGGGGPTGVAGGLRSLAGIPLVEQQFFTNPQDAARQQFVLPSADPPPQPYLNLNVTGRWATPFGAPAGAGGGGGAPGGPGAMTPGAPPAMAPSPGGPGGPGGPPPPGGAGSGGPAGAPPGGK